MPLTTLADLVNRHAADRKGLGAFNVVHLEHAEFFVNAAEQVGQPIVLQISENAVRYHGSLAPIAAGTLAVARTAKIPVVVHLDHAESVDLVHEAVHCGFTSVMYDGAALDFEENVTTTRDVVSFCHSRGVSVEAELGEVGGKDGAHAPGVRTDPGDAEEFVRRTGVDALAVAVGSSHAMTDRSATPDNDLIARLAHSVPVPLVLHGSSGVSDEGMRAAIAAGITKVNVSTHLNVLSTQRIREILAAEPALVDPRKFVGPGTIVAAREVGRLLNWYAGVPPTQ